LDLPLTHHSIVSARTELTAKLMVGFET